MSIKLIVPTQNPGVLWPHWLAALNAQNAKVDVLVIDSSSTDGTNFNSLPAGFKFQLISANAFNHGGTRNLPLKHLPEETSIIVYMTQDALLASPNAIACLVDAFQDPLVGCAYGRQLPHANATPFAAHARWFNYPKESRTLHWADKQKLGLKACFFSNSFAAYRLSDLKFVGGFPSDVILGEDMSVAARLLMAGKSVAYVANACVFHSHNYSFLQEFRRYFDTGVFHVRTSWLLTEFGSAGGEGLRFVRSELAYLWRHAPWWIPAALLRTVAKLVGYRLGRLEAYWPLWLKRVCSMHKGFWK